ncbi:MAG: type II secretion system protein GspM [Sulfitobacter sp.]
MTARFIDMLVQRSPRERVLLGILIFVFLPVVVFFALLLPLRDAQGIAKHQQQDAIALHRWVNERVFEKNTMAQAPKNALVDPIGSSAIEQSLIDAGLRDAISDLSASEDGTIDLRFDLVRFTTLANWISANSRTWGYAMTNFRFEATQTDGKVSATLTLSPQI